MLLDLYEMKNKQHSAGLALLFSDYPDYFEALAEDRVIDAVDAYKDYRTLEFAGNYLRPTSVGAMLDATLRKQGHLAGVICFEHVGGQRLWNQYEKRFAVSIADLISQRLIHEDIRNNELHYRELSTLQQAIFDGANYSIISTDTDGIIRLFNNAATRMLGYAPEELIGKHTPLIFHDAEAVSQFVIELSEELGEHLEPGFEMFVTRVRRGQAEEREWTFIRKDGSSFPVLLSITAVRNQDGEVTGFLGIAFDITDRVLTKRALREEEARYRLLFENAGDGTFLMKGETFVDCNAATLEMFACSRDQILNQPPYRFSPEFQYDGRSSKDKALEKINAALDGKTQFFEWQHLRYDGTLFDAEVTLNAVEINAEPHILANVRNISDRKHVERELENSSQQLLHRNENLSLIYELSNRLHDSLSVDTIIEETQLALLGITHTPYIAIYLINENEKQLKLASSFGFNADTLNSGDSIPLDDSLTGLALQAGQVLVSSDFSTDDRLNHDIRQSLLSHGINSGAVIPLIYQNQPMGSINLVYDDDREFSDIELETFEAIGKTVSISLANAQHTQKLEIMAHHDSLTGLPNRLYLHQHFRERLKINPEQTAALLLLDLDRFKEINDTLGHHVGDKLLQKIGPRLEGLLKQHDTLLSRLGGDEFTILICEPIAAAEVLAYSQAILASLKKPFSIDSMILEVDVSIGVALYPMDGEDSHALLRSADVAMYEAKQKGLGVVRYDPLADKHTPQRLALIAELGTAIRKGQLRLHYQPKVDLRSGNVTGFEALVRWQHPQMDLLYPDKFIQLAEVSDGIHYLTQVVVELALAQQKKWRDAGYRFSVATNLSVRNLIDDRCVNFIEAMLKKYATEPGMLEMEITETALMFDPVGSISLLNRLSQLGVKLSIDDFGTGYSSLSYLRKMPISALKIDREFVADMLENEQDSVIVRSTVALAHNLDLQVVAEGVEDEATLHKLEKMGGDLVQGYFISKPADWSKMEDWLAASPYKPDEHLH